ncbi:hypothetical protein WN51_01380 [Melipona quadrifasciata]|uniref:Uncharacterized protein n=1 Tax=Melipona quadrifasciata TaxID=166423 RepID=A0A0N0BF92_9HYME|nr:hypothetical protein WN51_01380 [Melipona quadrifasciata]
MGTKPTRDEKDVLFATKALCLSRDPLLENVERGGVRHQQHPLPFPDARSGFSKDLERCWQGGHHFLRSPLIRFKGSA